MSICETSVGDVMTTRLLVVEQNQQLSIAEEMMRSARVRHILVVDEDGLLQGVLSQRDVYHGGLLKALGYGTRARQQALETLLVKEAMMAEPVTTTPNTPLSAAAKIMAGCRLGCLPVLQNERLVGILTEGDMVLVIAGQKGRDVAAACTSPRLVTMPVPAPRDQPGHDCDT